MVVATDGGRNGTTAAGAIAGRLFVVGCARSGTTLLQSLLAAHPAVLSFPETAVFSRLLNGGVMRSLRFETPGPGIAAAEADPSPRASVHRRAQLAYRRTTDLLDKLGRRDLEHILPIRSKSTREFADGFVGVLDRLARDRGKSWWVEKSPENLRFVREILELVPGAKFINILRDGRQNVTALYDMACKYPDRFWVKYRDLDQAIERWNICVGYTRRLLDVPEVLVVRYERLVSETEAVLEDVCRFAGLPFTRDMIDRRLEAAGRVVTSREPWKADVLTPMRFVVEDKFNELLTADQKAYVEARLERIDF
jgi:sulfotransferase family protein